ncbi:cupredoxin domain-containing protein [Rossellomorea sp. YZS02]|uniref:cupredoxin domain-containing protein n=1 Tax=Rossellomorea sp. YZS02 TaxID=3097358 RepID=UPI002A1462AE|nr:cupredoxin domain-containing protein [Rossellomorea sp. YZS02]MDX8345198.1 cupredoxin domain-containing protein [Rossellomorea sp. YZS02]
MYTGMSIGLTLGVMFGALYKGDLFYSTLLSIGIGSAAGLLIGLIHSPLSSIEGLMAGLMGGMMGAMLGEMISPNESIVILKVLSVLSLSSIFLFFIFPLTKPEQNLITKKWLFKPLIVFVTFLIFLVSSELIFKSATMPYAESPKEQTGYQSQYTHNSSNQHEEIHTINIIASDMRYQPSTLTVAKGTTARIVLQNDDQVEHDIEIKGITANITDSPGGGGHDHSSSNESFHLHAQANSSNQLEFLPSEKGVYEFFCTIPGHKEKGMTGLLIVT